MNKQTSIGVSGTLRHSVHFRSRQLKHLLQRPFLQPGSSRAAIHSLIEDAASSGPDDAPIFVLGAGWRTGSTLVQRMLNAQPGVLIWGEPFGEGAILQRLAESLAFLDPEHGRFYGRILPDDGELPTEDDWIANLIPPLQHLLPAHRALLDRLFRVPAASHGCSRWGIKEVVWGRDVIDLLAALYPASRFVLLVRNPVDQWRSYRPHTVRHPWFYRWPESPIGSPLSFGTMWNRLVCEYAAADSEVPQATLVRYEDLSSQKELDRLSAFLDLPVPLRVVSRVGSSVGKINYRDVPRWERSLLRRLTAQGAELVRYV